MKKVKSSKSKVRNATPVIQDGIRFRSKFELFTYNALKEANIEAEYEPTHYTLVPKFEYNGEKIRPMTYLPDFVSEKHQFIIECKGVLGDAFPLRWKLFKYTLRLLNKKYNLYLVRNQKQVIELINKLKDDYGC